MSSSPYQSTSMTSAAFVPTLARFASASTVDTPTGLATYSRVGWGSSSVSLLSFLSSACCNSMSWAGPAPWLFSMAGSCALSFSDAEASMIGYWNPGSSSGH